MPSSCAARRSEPVRCRPIRSAILPGPIAHAGLTSTRKRTVIIGILSASVARGSAAAAQLSATGGRQRARRDGDRQAHDEHGAAAVTFADDKNAATVQL